MLQGFLGNPVNGFWVVCLTVLCKITWVQGKMQKNFYFGKSNSVMWQLSGNAPSTRPGFCCLPQKAGITSPYCLVAWGDTYTRGSFSALLRDLKEQTQGIGNKAVKARWLNRSRHEATRVPQSCMKPSQCPSRLPPLSIGARVQQVTSRSKSAPFPCKRLPFY